jgi:hypothetical protein
VSKIIYRGLLSTSKADKKNFLILSIVETLTLNILYGISITRAEYSKEPGHGRHGLTG